MISEILTRRQEFVDVVIGHRESERPFAQDVGQDRKITGFLVRFATAPLIREFIPQGYWFTASVMWLEAALSLLLSQAAPISEISRVMTHYIMAHQEADVKQAR